MFNHARGVKRGGAGRIGHASNTSENVKNVEGVAFESGDTWITSRAHAQLKFRRNFVDDGVRADMCHFEARPSATLIQPEVCAH